MTVNFSLVCTLIFNAAGEMADRCVGKAIEMRKVPARRASTVDGIVHGNTPRATVMDVQALVSSSWRCIASTNVDRFGLRARRQKARRGADGVVGNCKFLVIAGRLSGLAAIPGA
jgi:hypothetical protein